MDTNFYGKWSLILDKCTQKNCKLMFTLCLDSLLHHCKVHVHFQFYKFLNLTLYGAKCRNICLRSRPASPNVVC